MLGRDRWAKEMINPDEEYDRLHDHCQALARERDALQRQIVELKIHLENAENYGECCDNIIVQYMPNWKDVQ
jgi:branched-subunit amino acid aminotransferase/4-amino-4-deoxychorismate lyase